MDTTVLHKELEVHNKSEEEQQRHWRELIELAPIIPKPIGIWRWRKCPKCRSKVTKEQSYWTMLTRSGDRVCPAFDYYKCVRCDYERSEVTSDTYGLLPLDSPMAQEIEKAKEQKRLTQLQCLHSPVIVHETISIPSMTGMDYHKDVDVLMCSKCGKRL